MRELFIYYRSPEEHAAAVQARVHAFQVRLHRDHPALRARLMRRPEVKGGLITWMETYAIDPMTTGPCLDDALRRQIEAHAQCLCGLIEGVRHTEVFVPCAC
jgi:hypothetical protein